MSSPTTSSISPGWTLGLATGVGLAIALGVMFLPVVVIGDYLLTPEELDAKKTSAELGVGIAVIVRATARRLLRSGVQNVLRTTLGAFTRTAARTVTRRITRIALRQFTGLAFASVLRSGERTEEDEYTARDSALALGLGFGGLFVSFYGILAFLGPEKSAPVLQGLSPVVASLLAAAPLLLHAAITLLAARQYGVQATFHTQLDGLLLQGYFVGAGSFLPLTTDTQYRGGNDSSRAYTAAAALLGLVAAHLALNLLGRSLGSFPLQFAAAAVLMYAFVFAFPMPPLEGHHLWRRNKWLWAAVWLPTFVAFLANIPEAFAAIL